MRRTITCGLLVATTALTGGVVAEAGHTETAPPTSPPASDAGAVGEPLGLNLPDLPLLGPAPTGAGDRPTFSWQPVDGAVTYTLAILTADNEPLWAWQGTTTEVILGGWPSAPSPEAPGPLITGPATWFVVAFDAAGAPIAASLVRPVAP